MSAVKSPVISAVMRVTLLLAAAVAAHSQTGSLGSMFGSTLASGLALADTVPLSVPSIDPGGVVSGASFQPGIVPGSWVTIKGSNLSPVASDTR